MPVTKPTREFRSPKKEIFLNESVMIRGAQTKQKMVIIGSRHIFGHFCLPISVLHLEKNGNAMKYYYQKISFLNFLQSKD